MKRGVTLLPVLLLLSMGAISRGEEYKSPDGYSFSYPQGWIAISKTEKPEKMPADVAEFVAKCKVDWILATRA
jgi:hypothetical protein